MAGTGVLNALTAGGSAATIPDDPVLDFTTGFDFRSRLYMPVNPYAAGTTSILSHNSSVGGYSAAFTYQGFTPGWWNLRAFFSTDGVTQASVKYSGSLGNLITLGDVWVRAAWRSSDGRLRFYVNPGSNDVPTTWVQYGGDQTANVGPLFNSSASLVIGNERMCNIWRVQAWNGIEGEGGALVVDADFTKQPDGTTSFVEDASGLTVTVNGSARICNRTAA